jgi:glycine oxidase
VHVTVIGAGIIGLSIAHELASRGASVCVIDTRGVGLGATRASAGILAPYIEGHSDALRKLGLCSLAGYDAFVARVSADSGQPIEYRRAGTLQVARNAVEAQSLAGSANRLAEASVPHALLDAGPARAVEPALGDVTVALHIPEHGYVVVGALISALVTALAERGVTVTAGRVERIEDVEGDAVVIAAGSWSSQLEAAAPGGSDVAVSGVSETVASGAGLEIPVRPIRGQILHLRLPRPLLSHVIWGERCYLVPWLDGSVLVGATVEDVGFDERSTAAGIRSLLDGGIELLPELAMASLEGVRVGLRPVTTDELPVIGASSTMRRVFYATGHYRNGILLAPLTALAVADLVLDGREREELAPASPARFGL